MSPTNEGEVRLWRQVPGGLGDAAEDLPALTVHLPPPERVTGCGVIVCPGGGYRVLASDHEGLQVARALNRLGIAAFVLRYRLGPRYSSECSLRDGQRAVRHVRAHAVDYRIDRLGMLGFSAGGHVALAVGTSPHAGDAGAVDPVEWQSSRPDFLVGVYPVSNGPVRGRKADEYTPTDVRVDAGTPPTFLVHTHEDETVSPQQSLLFYEALLAAGVPAELHVFGNGEHGVGLAAGDPDVAVWLELLHRWLRRSGFLVSQPRVAVEGRVTVDGRAPGQAWVTLVPDNPDAPLARIRVDRAGDGYFRIDASHGPVAGRHRVLIHHISEQHPYTGAGAYSLDDAVTYQTSTEIRAGEPVVLALCSGSCRDLE